MRKMIEVEVVRSANGQIDVNATLANASNAIVKETDDEASDLGTIAEAVERVWSERPTLKSMNLDAIVSYTVPQLTNGNDNFAEVSKRVKDYVRNATDIFVLVKGQGGGYKMLSRLTDEERTAALASREKATEKKAAKQAA